MAWRSCMAPRRPPTRAMNSVPYSSGEEKGVCIFLRRNLGKGGSPTFGSERKGVQVAEKLHQLVPGFTNPLGLGRADARPLGDLRRAKSGPAEYAKQQPGFCPHGFPGRSAQGPSGKADFCGLQALCRSSSADRAKANSRDRSEARATFRSTFPRAPLRSRKVGFPDSGSDPGLSPTAFP